MRNYLKRVEAHSVVVNTGDSSIRGVLVGVYADVLVLKHAAYLAHDGSQVTIDGEALVPRDRVTFIQRLECDK